MVREDRKLLQRALKLFFLFEFIEGIAAFVWIFAISADPKNAWFLGYSKPRLVMGIGMLLVVGLFAWLTIKSWKNETWLLKVNNQVADFAAEYRLSFPMLWAAFGLLIFGSYTYLLLVSPLDATLIRILPPIMFAFALTIQTLLLFFAHLPKNEEMTVPEIEDEQLIIVKSRKVVAILSAIIVLLILSGIIAEIVDRVFQSPEITDFAGKFYFDWELNIPTYFSSFILLLSAALFGFIAVVKRRMGDKFARHWIFLAIIFAYLSVDETAVIHEMLIWPIRALFNRSSVLLPSIFFFAWLIVAIPILLVIVIAYFRFFLHLPKKTRTHFLIAAFLYLGGAIGMEMVGGSFLDWPDKKSISSFVPLYLVITTVEETLEMVGIVILIYALLEYIRLNLQGKRFRIIADNP